VKRATSNETEKNITTVKVASSAPKKPLRPEANQERIIARIDAIVDGITAPRHIA
jgi:hypothetical protein